jgi:aminopeptidase C
LHPEKNECNYCNKELGQHRAQQLTAQQLVQQLTAQKLTTNVEDLTNDPVKLKPLLRLYA